MKRIHWVLCGLLIVGGASSAFGMRSLPGGRSLHKALAPALRDAQTTIDANQLEMFVTNFGSFAYDIGAVRGKNDGLYYPKGTDRTVIFAGGLWLGARVNGQLRVSLSEHAETYVPGPMVDGTFQTDAAEFKVYRIKRGLLNAGFYDRPRPTQQDSVVLWDDYNDWPARYGAPINGSGRPELIGDQTLWSVYNDADPANHVHVAASTEGLGVEVQQTTFAFDRAGPLSHCIFMKFLVINKSSDDLEEMFISVWSDPDVGDWADDLVGCDTTLSLGYCYNGTNNDSYYGSKPPAVGYDFFQGPIVPGEESDWAIFMGDTLWGYRNLPMTSFNQYVNGTDPFSPQETYNYMRGLGKMGEAVIDPTTGEPTTFMFPGNPVTRQGWRDSNPADRRYMQSAGPFNMAPGDTQEVVVAIIVGQGSDRLTSITALKYHDEAAQSAFDKQFNLPDPPARPVVETFPMDQGIVLSWGTRAEDQPGDYVFQGYNIYQGQTIGGPWKRVATYDIDDGEGVIFDREFVIEENAVIEHPVQYGSDSGIRRHLKVTYDAWRGVSLNNLTDYFWAVTAYSFDPNQAPKTLENAPAAILSTPQKPAGGYVYFHDYADTLITNHVAGISDGLVTPLIVDPSVLTGHEYQVEFTTDEEGIVYWHLYDLDTREYVLRDQTNQTGDDDYLVTDGFVCLVVGPHQGVSTILEIATGDGELATPADVAYAWNSTGEYYLSSDQFDDFTRLDYMDHIGMQDWEIRFTSEGSEYFDWFTDFDNTFPFNFKYADRAPFEVWNIGAGTPNDPSDDIRLQFMIIDVDGSGADGGVGWTPGDLIYVLESEYPVEPLPEQLEFGVDYDFTTDINIGRIQINASVPQEGTVIRFTTNKVNAPGDQFTFSTPATIEEDFAADDEYNLSNVKVVPNPYFNYSAYEPNQFAREVRFENLPYTCEIKVFNLAGDHLVTLNKEPSDQSWMSWNILTKHQLPLASGLYIYLVTAPDGENYVGKMAIFTEVEKLRTY